MNKDKSPILQPFSIITINRILVILVIALAILSGYFHAKYANEYRKNNRLNITYQSCQKELQKFFTTESEINLN